MSPIDPAQVLARAKRAFDDAVEKEVGYAVGKLAEQLTADPSLTRVVVPTWGNRLINAAAAARLAAVGYEVTYETRLIATDRYILSGWAKPTPKSDGPYR